MKIDKTYSELWDLVNNHEDETVRETAQIAINTLQKQQELIETQARVLDGFIDDTAKLVARNLVAWDTSKDKREGLLPVVYLKNKLVYKELTGEEYVQCKAILKYRIS
ncbi:hypothetical protein JNUCC23_08845 [Peribacillus sp. JNUCC 23]